ncbi:MAG: ECF-type sigma factor [Planctomycetota bacterium]
MEEPTHLIRRAAAGDRDAHDEVFHVLRPEMERIAEGLMRREPREVTMQAGVLISELYVKLRTAFEGRALSPPGGQPEDWECREQFLRYATVAMKSILIDSARRRTAAKRGGESMEAVVTDEALSLESPPELLLFFDEAAQTLREDHPEEADLLEMVRFGGLSPRAAGAALDMSRRKTEEAWTYLQAWLAREWGLRSST